MLQPNYHHNYPHTGKQNKESVGEQESLNYIYSMQSTIYSTVSQRQRWHLSIHPFSCTQSCICTLQWARVLPTQWFLLSYLQKPDVINRVRLCEHHLPPRNTKILPYQGCIFFVSNKLQNEICSALIISNVIYFLISSC